MRSKYITIILTLSLLLSNTTEAKGLKNPYGRAYVFKATAYCNCKTCCGKWSGGPTKSGKMPGEGRTIAVDPKRIPLGKTVLVYYKNVLMGIYEAEDTGTLIKGNRIDVFFNSHKRAKEWGIRKVKIYVVNAKG